MLSIMDKQEWTLTGIAKLLQQPQHRLIYLCEKGVIVPDGTDAEGRGSSRRFSARNLFEFSIALTLGEFHIPAIMSGKVLLALRSFEKVLKQTISNLDLPYALRTPNAPEIRVLLTNGSCLYFAIGEGGRTKLIGGVDLLNHQGNVNWPSITEIPVNSESSTGEYIWRLAGSERAYFEVNITQIAKDLPIKHRASTLKLVS